jgi:hypothetical protein
MEITYAGPWRGSHMLAGDLVKAGALVDWEEPEEPRGHLADNPYVVAMVVQYSPKAAGAVLAAIEKLRKRFGDKATIDERIV